MRRAGSRLALAVVLVLTACGSRVDWEAHEAALSAQEAPQAATSPSPEPVAQPSPSPSALPPASPSAGSVAAAEDEPAPAPEAEPAEQELNILLEITIEPPCVHEGEPIAARIVTEPRSELSLIVSYSDGDPHGMMGFGLADNEGVFVWRWAITPEVPPGPATLLVGSANNESGNGDATAESFEVAGPEGCA